MAKNNNTAIVLRGPKNEYAYFYWKEKENGKGPVFMRKDKIDTEVGKATTYNGAIRVAKNNMPPGYYVA